MTKSVCNGYYKVSELNDILQGGFHSSFLEYDDVVWFVNEVLDWKKDY